MNQLAYDIHEWAQSKGFYDREAGGNTSLPSEKLLLIVSEVVEAQSALRDDDIKHEEEEIADTIIRVLDYCAWRGFDIDAAVQSKMETNLGRPYLHGRTF